MGGDRNFKRSANLAHLEASVTVAIKQDAQRRIAAGEDVIDLSVGEPDFDTPRLAADAGIQAIRDGKTHYPPNHGILDLRAAAARHLSLLSGGRPVNADHVVVSSGARQSIFNACFALFGSGDRVLIPAPGWVSYPQLVHFARATPVLVPGAPEWSLKVGVDELQQAYDARVAGLILCSPVNPTGAVYTRAELQELMEWAAERNLWVIADEMYRRIHFGSGPAPSVYDLSDDLLERTVLVTGVSKTYSMTGWRVGLAVAPPDVTKAMAAFQSHTTAGASQAGQWAAAAALADERLEADVDRMVKTFRQRRDRVVEHFRMQMPGVEFVEPMGAFYFFFRVDSFGSPQPMTGRVFCERLLAEGVALVPGEAFGDGRWARLSFAASDDALARGLERITRLVHTLQREETA